MFIFDRETTLRRGEDPDRALLPITETYINFSGAAFGGWTLASAIEAVETHPEFRGRILTANAMFLDGLTTGAAHIRARILSRKNRTDFWRVEFFTDAEETNLAFSVDLVATLDRQSAESYEAPPPVRSSWDEVEPVVIQGGPKWMKNFEIRPLKGRPFHDGDDTYSLVWIRDAERRPLDLKGIAAIADSPPPRVFFLSAKLRIVSTLSLTLTLCADAETLAEAGADPVLLEVDSDRVGEGRFHQRARLWSARGGMLATSDQVAVFGKPFDQKK